MSVISKVNARQIFDSRGVPTVECEVILDSGEWAMTSVPSGASTGIFEAHELRDNNDKQFHGKGVSNAVKNINEIIGPKITGMNPQDQCAIDHLMIELDGTEQKEKLGANAILAVSISVAKAAAFYEQIPFYEYLGGDQAVTLPVPFINLINGGQHASNNLDIQEFMIVPVGFHSYKEALRCGVEIFHTLKKILIKDKLSVAVGDEGGFAPELKSNKKALDLLVKAIEASGYKPGEEVFLALDLASSSFYKDGLYCLANEKNKYTIEGWVDLMAEWIDDYPIISIEDAMAEEDFTGWELITKELGREVQLVGDDVFVTNPKRLSAGIKQHMGNSILIKLNQIGTLTETLQTMQVANVAGYNSIISHRSGETEDTTIADLAVATNSGQIKTGGLCRTERICKYNRLLRIEEQLADRAAFLGVKALNFGKQPQNDGK